MDPFKIKQFLGFLVTLYIILSIVPLIKSESFENVGRSEYFKRHEHHEHSEHFEHSEHSMNTMNTMNNGSQGELYMGVGNNPFWVKEQTIVLWLHIISMAISFGILIPLGITLGFANVKSKWFINVYFIGLITSIMGYLFGVMFNLSKSQDIYPGNFHSKFGWVLLIMLLIQMSIGFIQLFDGRNHKIRKIGFVKIRLANESNESLVDSNSSESSHDVESSTLLDDSIDSSQKEFIPTTQKQQSKLSHIKIIYNIISYTLIILVYTQFLLGFITLSDTCHGEAFGNCLAHYVKGSIFILFGLVTFARYLGFFEKFGWEWNSFSISPSVHFNDEKNQKGKISFSLLESIIIFTYGITNTFLEHTGKGPWNHRDIQHASLAFMWWWAGSLGIILENKRIRKFLFSNSSNLKTSIENPIPSIIFMITAISMGSHHQATEFSLGVHKQFGGFLFLAGLFRIFTIIILYFNNINNNSNVNNIGHDNNNISTIIHPPTEFISSFCFVASGITLMIANKSAAFLFDSIYDFDVNFILHLVVSLSFFTFSFITIFLFIYKYFLSYSK